MPMLRVLAAAVVVALPALALAQSGSRLGGPTEALGPVLPSLTERAVFNENFTNVAVAPNAAGTGRVCALNMPGFNATQWFGINNSFAAGNVAATGSTCIFNPSGTPPFPAQGAGEPANAYLAMNFNNTTGANNINTWVVTPRINWLPNARVEFFLRGTGSTFPDRLQVRLSTAADTGTPDVGGTSDTVGTFTTLLLDVNPGLSTANPACGTGITVNAPGTTVTGFPSGGWCRFTINASAGLPSTGSGRIAFRYFVTGAGPAGANSDFIGIDTFSVDEGLAPQGPVQSAPVNTLSWMGLGALGLLLVGGGLVAVRRFA